MKVVLYDARDGSPTKGEVNEFFMGEHRPIVLRIPPLVYHGFKTVSQEEALLVNVSTQVYRHDAPDEFRVHPHENDIPYKWARKDGGAARPRP
jgi:dTDP-4-dehydrorhamnose 3,5-epimerase